MVNDKGELIVKIYRDNGENSLDTIMQTQKKLGVNYPKSYIDLMLKHDALRLENDVFDFINIYGNEDERDICFLSFKENHINGSVLSEQENISDLDNYGIKDLVIFGSCANGDYICFDYRENPNSSEPKIVLVYHDDFIDYDDGTSTMVVNHVAENFDDFLKLLHE